MTYTYYCTLLFLYFFFTRFSVNTCSFLGGTHIHLAVFSANWSPILNLSRLSLYKFSDRLVAIWLYFDALSLDVFFYHESFFDLSIPQPTVYLSETNLKYFLLWNLSVFTFCLIYIKCITCFTIFILMFLVKFSYQ